MTATLQENTPMVQISNVAAGYRDNIVLEDINLDIQKNDFIGLIGPNGGGKTTLLKTILGLIKPYRGNIQIMGEPVEKGRGHIGYVPQFAEFDFDFPISVRDVVRMGRLSSRHLFRSYTKQDEVVAEECLASVDMLEHEKRGIRELSGGQRQRVYIARALATQPDLLLLDEPTVSVDYDSRTHIYELLHQINLQGVTILLISHDLNVISSYVKTIGCLNRTLHYHREKEITIEMLNTGYNCPVDLIAHGLPHRVLAEHEG